MAPEQLLRKELQCAYNHKVDIWAVGIIVFKMIQGWDVEPYTNTKNMTDLKTLVKVIHNNAERWPHFGIEKYFKAGNDCSELCKDFMHKALMIDPDKRKSARQLLKHRWIKKYYQSYLDRAGLG